MYVEIVSGGQPFTAGRVCFKKNEFCPLGKEDGMWKLQLLKVKLKLMTNLPN